MAAMASCVIAVLLTKTVVGGVSVSEQNVSLQQRINTGSELLPNSSLINMTGTNALSTSTTNCMDGSIAPRKYFWNVLYEPEDNEGLDISVLPAATSQNFVCGYTSSDSASGLYNSWVGAQIFGLHPMVYDPAGKIQSWGGVPQNLSMQEHVAVLQRAIDLTLPADFDGILGLDFEGWQPVWDGFLYGGIKTVSEALVRAKHPSWDNATVLAQAQLEFEAAAKTYYLTTIQTLKAARPKMRVGFYDTPFRGWHSYAETEYAASQQAHNNNLTWLWEAVDVLTPVLYLPTRGADGPIDNATNIRALLQESERIAEMVAAKGGKRLPVVPWTWLRTGAKGNASFFGNRDMYAEMVVPFEFPSVEGIAVWGDNAVGDVTITALREHYHDTFLPLAQASMSDHCDCAQKMCAGHGRCVWNNTQCLCYPPYSGMNCSEKEYVDSLPQAPTDTAVSITSNNNNNNNNNNIPSSNVSISSNGIAPCSDSFERWCFLANTSVHRISSTSPWPSYQSGCCKKCNETSGCLSWQYLVDTAGKTCELYSVAKLPAQETYKCVCSADATKIPNPPGPPPHPSPQPPPPPPPPTPFVPWPLPLPPAPPAVKPKPAGAVMCGDGVSYCPPANTCGQLTTGMWACCPLPNATVCAHAYCCPHSQLCDVKHDVCYTPNNTVTVV